MLARLFRWFLGLELFGRVMVGVFVFVVFTRLFYTEENWRGKRAWEACRRELIAQGVELNPDKYPPPPVPDDQNFAMTPFLAPLFDFNPKPRQPGQSPWRDVEGRERAGNFGAALLPENEPGRNPLLRLAGQMTDLERSLRLLRQNTNSSSPSPSFSNRTDAAAAVLEALEQYKPVLDELRAASHRPYSRFNVEYDAEDPMTILLPHLQVLRRASKALEVRASAALVLGKTEATLDDIRFMFFLADSIHNEPFIVSHMVRATMLQGAQQIIWEGLAQQRWSVPQLRDLQTHLEKITLLKDVGVSLGVERAAFGNKAFEFVRNRPHELRQLAGWDDNAAPLRVLLVAPSGWLYLEQVSYHRLHDEEALAGFDPQAGQIHPRIIDENKKRSDNYTNSFFSTVLHHRAFARLMLGGFCKVFQRTAVAQTGADQAAIACALERYRLANGKYPETLDALVPQFVGKLPVDVCTGQPLKYRRTDDGRFVLYSVGWNETDDGGKIVLSGNDSQTEITQGDWIWPQYVSD